MAYGIEYTTDLDNGLEITKQLIKELDIVDAKFTIKVDEKATFNITGMIDDEAKDKDVLFFKHFKESYKSYDIDLKIFYFI